MNNTEFMRALGARLDAGESVAVATVVRVVSPMASRPGMRAMILADGSLEGWIGGGCAQSAVVKAALECLKAGGTRLLKISPEAEPESTPGAVAVQSHCQSRGSADIFVDTMRPGPQLWVYGESPAAIALVDIAARTGFAVTLKAVGETGAEPNEASSTHTQAGSISPDFAVIATQGRGDRAAIEAAVLSAAPFVAMIASARKATALKQTLIERGLDADRVRDIQCPAGLDINAKTPEEVALAVVAQLVQQLRSTDEALGSDTQSIGSSAEPSVLIESGSCCGDGG